MEKRREEKRREEKKGEGRSRVFARGWGLVEFGGEFVAKDEEIISPYLKRIGGKERRMF